MSITIELKPEIEAALRADAEAKGQDAADLAKSVLERMYRPATQARRQTLTKDPEKLKALYQEFAEEDRAMAEEDLSEFDRLLKAEDQG